MTGPVLDRPSCRTCRWWYELPGVTDHGACDLTERPTAANPPEHKGKRMHWLITEPQNAEAWLLTTPDFGCVRYEPDVQDALPGTTYVLAELK